MNMSMFLEILKSDFEPELGSYSIFKEQSIVYECKKDVNYVISLNFLDKRIYIYTREKHQISNIEKIIPTVKFNHLKDVCFYDVNHLSNLERIILMSEFVKFFEIYHKTVDVNNIFAFWESKETMPAYLELCQETWSKNIPNCRIHVLNYSNLYYYIGDTYNLDDLKKISFAMQSDIISAAVLEKFGGLFLDIDCIVTANLFDIFNKISHNKLISFGDPLNYSIHLAVLYCKNPNNPILTKWRTEAQIRLKNLPENFDWSYFGNSIMNPLIRQDKNKNSFILDRKVSGNILESSVLGNDRDKSIEYYRHFYFNPYLSFNKNSLKLVRCGVISLHNSWTPQNYKQIKDKSEFLQQEIPLSSMLDYVLKNDNFIDFDNTIIATEIFLRKSLSEKSIVYEIRYIESMLVVDIKYESLNFAIDINCQNGGKKIADLVLRNINPSCIQKSDYFIKHNMKFVKNKCRLGIYNNNQDILCDILTIYQKIKKLNNSALVDRFY